MKSFFLLNIMVLLAACGKADNPGSRAETRAYSPVLLSVDERTTLTRICNALANKASALSTTTTQNLNFAVSQRNCSTQTGFAAGSETIVPVTVHANPPEYKLRRTDNGNAFVYPDVETHTTGLMRTVCANLETATNPRRLDNGNSMWINTTGISSNDCNPRGNEICLLVETGVPAGDNFDITSREWLKFQMDPALALYGFFTERRTLTSSLCGVNQTSQIKATLAQ